MSNNFYARLDKRILPFFNKGQIFYFDFDQSDVYAYLDGKLAEYPLRAGLGGYLWLCLYEKGYFTRAESIDDLLSDAAKAVGV